MNRWTIIRRSVWYYRRTHLGVIAGAALAAAVLTGALIVGDCLRHTLHWMATARLGDVQQALVTEHPTLDTNLLNNFVRTTNMPAAGVLQYRGVARKQGASQQDFGVQVNGVDADFWRVGGVDDQLAGMEDGVAINTHLARKLDLAVGDVLILRLPKASALSMDMPIGSVADDSTVFNAPVRRIIGDRNFGRFSLFASQVSASNVFLPRRELLEYTDARWIASQPKPSGAEPFNLMLVGRNPHRRLTAQQAQEKLAYPLVMPRHLGYHQESFADGTGWRLSTERVFFDAPMVELLHDRVPPHDVVFSYLANEMRIGDRAAPYSMACGYGRSDRPIFPAVNDELGSDEIVLNRWLADDLRAKIGDKLTMTYYVVGAGRKLTEQSHTFSVVGFLPMSGIGADKTLMPSFPGITDSDDINDWNPGFAIDLSKIREKDEKYWDDYRGAPKAFVNLKTAQKLWGNRWGNVTQVRFARQDSQAIVRALHEDLKPGRFGMTFRPVHDQALRAASQGQDFTGLFLGLSMFLIAAAILLTGLLFVFGIEQRAGQIGTMLALGFTPRRIAAMLIGESFLLALVGTVIGVGLAVGYAWGVLALLGGVWRGAVSTADLMLIVRPSTLLSGAVSSVLVSLLAMAWTLRRQLRRTPRQLLGGLSRFAVLSTRKWKSWIGAGASILLAITFMLLKADAPTQEQLIFAFFSGVLVLWAAILVTSALFDQWSGKSAAVVMDLRALGRRNCVRRKGRSMAVVALLGCGLFMVIAVTANTKTPPTNPDQRSSPTGGFELYAESALPIYHDLNADDGRKEFALDAQVMREVNIIPLRVRAGDDASCLNLNRPQQPRLVGVPAQTLAILQPFTLSAPRMNLPQDQWWDHRLTKSIDGSVPAFVDAGTAQWILKKKIGDTIDYTDERGRTFQVKLVGFLNDTILQGSLMISERHFIERYPDLGGYRAFLIDAPAARTEQVRAHLAERLSDVGFDITATPQRLAEFNAVQNTYLAIFAALGGLGMALGSIGLGIVAARNILERRGELALMRAVGFESSAVRRMLNAEHDLLLALGVGAGMIAAAVAIAPTLLSPDAPTPYAVMFAILGIVLCSGALWVRLAGRWALKGSLLNALRQE